MANNKKWAGILVLALVLVFGMVAIGCGDGGGPTTPPPILPPEEQPTAERWDSLSEAPEETTIHHSVGADDVCTITVGGTAQKHRYISPEDQIWNRWVAAATYSYTAQANTRYTFEFEAWKDGAGDRPLSVQYYSNAGIDAHMHYDIELTTTRKSYALHTIPMPQGGVFVLEFQCADNLGTFHIKMTDIKVETAPIDDLTAGTWVTGTLANNNSANCYKLNVTSGDGYMWINDSVSNSSGGKTGKVSISACYSDGVTIFYPFISYSDGHKWTSDPEHQTVPKNGLVYIMVTTSDIGSGGAGTYAFAYSITDTQP